MSWQPRTDGYENDNAQVLSGPGFALPLPMADLLWQRGVRTQEEAQLFLDPMKGPNHDPIEMADMDKAIARLHQAITTGERVMVLGDYDVDGTTATALFAGLYALRAPGRVETYTPDRFSEGYGISEKAIAEAAALGCSLVVALDCGIKSNELIAHAATLGIDFIVCDHHQPGEQLPLAAAVLDPRRQDCPYPCKDLTGCAIGYKLWEAYYEHHKLDLQEVDSYLDLVAISICADVTPILGETRHLTALGLARLNDRPRPGIAALLAEARRNGEVDTQTVLFTIAPRLNAAGRMGHGSLAVRLLMEADRDKAYHLAEEVSAANTLRRARDLQMTEEAVALIAAETAWQAAPATVLYAEGWHQGVVGITASRVIERYPKPTVILTLAQDGRATGSARSVEGVDVLAAITACADLLDQYGGHRHAAGLTLAVGNVEAFRARFTEQVAAQLATPLALADGAEPQPPTRHGQAGQYDLALPISRATFALAKRLTEMAPHGPGNSRPMFYAQATLVEERSRVIEPKEAGRTGHLALRLADPDNPQATLDVMGWNLAAHWPALLDAADQGRPIEILYHLELHRYKDYEPVARGLLREVKC